MQVGPFNFPYRWLLRTIIPNIKSGIDDLRYGIRNVFIWTPVIWFDADCDWSYLARIMEFKMRRMAKHHKEHGCVVDSPRIAKELLICAELLKRLSDDDVDFERVKLHDKKMTHYNEYLGKMIGKHLRGWWD
jgi:hypothetical protein